MKTSSFVILGLSSLVSSSVARQGSRFRAYDDDENPIEQKSRVTAFVNTDQGLKIECWQIGDLLPQSHVPCADKPKETFRSMKMGGISDVALFSFPPAFTLFTFGRDRSHNNAIDSRSRPNLFTVKDGLIIVQTDDRSSGNRASRKDDDDDDGNYIFSSENGDDWFYMEDETSSSRHKRSAERNSEPVLLARTISGSDTNLINFQYEHTPPHKVLHEGRCNFAGLTPVNRGRQSESDSGTGRLQSQDLK